MTDPKIAMVIDQLEIMDRISDLALGLDLSDPPRYRRCFADSVDVCNPTFADDGVDSVITYTGDQWAHRVSSAQAALPIRMHLLGCPSIDIAGDRADVVVNQRAQFTDDIGSYTVAGPLRLEFIRTAGSWRVCRLQFDVVWTDGDSGVYERARKAGR